MADSAEPAKPQKIQKLMAHASECIAKYELESAIKFYEKAVSICPDDTDLLDASGELCVELGRTEDAINLFKRSIGLKPNENSFKYMNLGQLLSGEDSLQLFQKGVELMQGELSAMDSQDQDAITKMKARLCSAYCSMNEIYMTDLCDQDGAEHRCEEFLTLGSRHAPNSPELYVQWANLRLCQCRQEDAQKMTYKALSLCNALEEQEKPSLEVRIGIVKLLIELGQLDEAEEFGHSLLEVDDEFVETWYLLALINYNQQLYAKAHECITAATKILDKEGVTDEEQAARVQELAEEIEKHDHKNPEGMGGESEDEEMEGQDGEMADGGGS